MYAGTTYGKRSGQVIGVHQRIDKIARLHLKKLLLEGEYFPNVPEIHHFEGDNGPDGIKRKSPSVDEPWHYIDPNKPNDTAVVDMILDHQHNLAEALRKHNPERAAFEAAWMAHAIVDGLTPAHHYPLADKIEELFGMPHQERTTVRKKVLISGDSRRDTLSKNWQYWGRRGIFANHFMFEFAIARAILNEKYGKIEIHPSMLEKVQKDGYSPVFDEIFKQVINLKTYEEYMAQGWSKELSTIVKLELIPLIVSAVMLGWYASIDASRHKKKEAAL
jgi:hypothetical protein